MLRKLTSDEIKKLVSRRNVRKKALGNFLAAMDRDLLVAAEVLQSEPKSHNWNTATISAAYDGVALAKRPLDRKPNLYIFSRGGRWDAESHRIETDFETDAWEILRTTVSDPQEFRLLTRRERIYDREDIRSRKVSPESL